MNTLERTTGNAFTRDVDYNEFLGAPKRVARYDWTIRKYRWMVVSEPKTPKDAVTPTNPDAVIADDGTDVDGNTRREMEAYGKTREALRQIRQLLLERPLSTRELADLMGATLNRVKAIMINHPEDFEIVTQTRRGHVYALKGHTYPERYLTKSMPKLVAHLREHGPNTINQIYELTRVPIIQIYASIKDNPGVMVRIGSRKTRRGMTDVWGLAGVHDQQEMA